MPKFAAFDPASASIIAPVLGWYDLDAIKYPNLPPESHRAAASDEIWADMAGRCTGAYSIDKSQTPPAIVPTPPPSQAQQLAGAQAAKIASLRAACTAQITGGYSSSALGAPHTYPSSSTDQINMLGSVSDSQLTHAPGWTTPFWCMDSSGVWAFADHSAAQIQQAGSDGKTAIVAAQRKLGALTEQVMAATTVEAVQAIGW